MKYEIFLLSLSVILIAVSSIAAIEPGFASNGPLPFSYSGQNLTPYASEYYLESGVKVTEGILCNPTNETSPATVNYGKITFDAIVERGGCWKFADIGGVLVYSPGTGTNFIFNDSVYYETNKWLMLRLSGNCSSPIIIFSPAVYRIAGSSASWNYDFDSGKATIYAFGCPEKYLSIDFSAYPSGQGNIFVEDYTKFDELNWKLRSLGSEISALRNYNRDLANSINETYEDSIKLESIVNKEISEKNSFSIYIDERGEELENATNNNTAFEEKISNSTIMNSVQFFLVIAIILAMALYVAMYFIRDFRGSDYGKK